MGSSYTNVKRKGRKKKTFQKFLKPVISLVFIGLSCSTVYTLMPLFESDNTPVPEARDRHRSLDELTRIETFIPAYLEVNGNETLLNNTQTLRVSGEIETNSELQTFQLFKKRPGLMRINIGQRNQEMTVGVNSTEVWKRIRTPLQSEITEISGPEAAKWRADARIFDRIVSAHLGDGRILGIEADEWSGRDCLEVEVKDDAEQAVLVRVDPNTMYPLSEEQRMDDGSTMELVMKDYRIVDGLPVAFIIERTIDGAFKYRVRLDSAKLNSGLLSQVFERPKKL